MSELNQSLPGIEPLIRAGIEQKWHHGIQVYVSHRGETVANAAVGNNTPEAELQPDTLTRWLSAGKPLTAAAILKLCEAGALSVYDPVCKHIPEFADANKQDVLVWHLLTHTAGLKPVVSGWPQATWEEIVAKICRAPLRPEWVLGSKGAYDPGNSWFILGELIQRLSGRPVNVFVKAEVCDPLGISDARMCFTSDDHAQYASRIGVTYAEREGELVATRSHLPESLSGPAPGASMRGPAADLGQFYEMLLRSGRSESGEVVLQEETVGEMTKRWRVNTFDQTFCNVLDFGLGLIINSQQYAKAPMPYGYGRYASAETFGHGGAQSSVGFADPVHELVVVLIANGCPGEPVHQRRFHELVNQIYVDLGLAESAS